VFGLQSSGFRSDLHDSDARVVVEIEQPIVESADR